MRKESGYRILEIEDIIDQTALAEINEELEHQDLDNTFLVDTRFTTVDSRSPGYNSNLMIYSETDTKGNKEQVEDILSGYFKQEDIALNYTGESIEHNYLEPVNL